MTLHEKNEAHSENFIHQIKHEFTFLSQEGKLIVLASTISEEEYK